MGDAWSMKGTVVVACNCDYGCPCNFQALPTMGKCEGGWTWHVDEGAYGDVRLDGITFTLTVNWPGAIHEGDGVAVLLVDERSDDAQRDAIHTLVKGDVGGPWGVLGWTWPTLEGPEAVPYELQLDGIRAIVRAGDLYEVESEPIRNPVTGAEIDPRRDAAAGDDLQRGHVRLVQAPADGSTRHRLREQVHGRRRVRLRRSLGVRRA